MSSFYERPKRSDEIYHYGVIGMKWGQHKFTRKEIRADNKKAFELGKNATISNRALHYSTKRLERAQKRYDNAILKDPIKTKRSTLRKQFDLEVSKKSNKRISDTYKKDIKNVSNHSKSLINKYGKEHVSNLKYDKKGRVNERITSGEDWAKSAALSVAISSITVPTTGFSVLSLPRGKSQRGRDMSNSIYYRTRKDLKKDSRVSDAYKKTIDF